jgi:hypothetical protein
MFVDHLKELRARAGASNNDDRDTPITTRPTIKYGARRSRREQRTKHDETFSSRVTNLCEGTHREHPRPRGYIANLEYDPT